MRVLTCNIRYMGGSDGADAWHHRRDLAVDVIKAQAPDIICFQEMWDKQREDLCAALPGFEWYGLVDEPMRRHPVNSIFFRAAAFACISAGGHWLSETPHVTGSKSWDSDCIRLVNWLRLEEVATKREFRVINTHLDHVGQTAREMQAKLIVEDAEAFPEAYPQILTGDMNCDESNKAIGVLKAGGWRDTYGAIHGTESPGFTYHAFLGPEHQRDNDIGKMDWIFVKGGIQVLDAKIIRDSRNGRFPSDHYFVSADVCLGEDSGRQL